MNATSWGDKNDLGGYRTTQPGTPPTGLVVRVVPTPETARRLRRGRAARRALGFFWVSCTALSSSVRYKFESRQMMGNISGSSNLYTRVQEHCDGFGNDRVAEDFMPSSPEIGSFYSERAGKGFLSDEFSMFFTPAPRPPPGGFNEGSSTPTARSWRRSTSAPSHSWSSRRPPRTPAGQRPQRRRVRESL